MGGEHDFRVLKPLGLVLDEVQKKGVCFVWRQTHTGSFPFVECAGIYVCGGGDGFGAVAAQVDCGPKQGFGFCECGVLFHVLTSMGKVVRLEWDSGFFYRYEQMI